jgi:protein TonB
MRHLLFVVLISYSAISYSQHSDSTLRPRAAEPAYRMVEVMPEYPGGPDSLASFIKANLKYPRAARENSMSGKVVIEAIVEKDGSLSDIRIKTAVFPKLDEEALRIVKLLPKYNPGQQKGKPVRVIISLPVIFKLPVN